MSNVDVNVVLDAAKEYARKNVKQGAVELLELSQTGIIPADGVVSKCRLILQDLKTDNLLSLAATLFQHAALEEVARGS